MRLHAKLRGSGEIIQWPILPETRRGSLHAAARGGAFSPPRPRCTSYMAAYRRIRKFEILHPERHKLKIKNAYTAYSPAVLNHALLLRGARAADPFLDPPTNKYNKQTPRLSGMLRVPTNCATLFRTSTPSELPTALPNPTKATVVLRAIYFYLSRHLGH